MTRAIDFMRINCFACLTLPICCCVKHFNDNTWICNWNTAHACMLIFVIQIKTCWIWNQIFRFCVVKIFKLKKMIFEGKLTDGHRWWTRELNNRWQRTPKLTRLHRFWDQCNCLFFFLSFHILSPSRFISIFGHFELMTCRNQKNWTQLQIVYSYVCMDNECFGLCICDHNHNVKWRSGGCSNGFTLKYIYRTEPWKLQSNHNCHYYDYVLLLLFSIQIIWFSSLLFSFMPQYLFFSVYFSFGCFYFSVTLSPITFMHGEYSLSVFKMDILSISFGYFRFRFYVCSFFCQSAAMHWLFSTIKCVFYACAHPHSPYKFHIEYDFYRMYKCIFKLYCTFSITFFCSMNLFKIKF